MKKINDGEVIEPGTFTKRFCSNYIAILILALLITDIVFKANDYENIVLIRGITMTLAIIIGVITVNIGLSKKYIVKRDMKDFYSRYVIIAVVAIAFLSILYFMYCVKSEVEDVKNSSQYRIAESIYGTKYTDKVLDDAADEARKQWYSIWGIMLCASIVTIPITKKLFDKYSKDYEETKTDVLSNRDSEENLKINNK